MTQPYDCGGVIGQGYAHLSLTGEECVVQWLGGCTSTPVCIRGDSRHLPHCLHRGDR